MKFAIALLLVLCSPVAGAREVICRGSQPTGMMYFLPDEQLLISSDTYGIFFGTWRKVNDTGVLVAIPVKDGEPQVNGYKMSELRKCNL
jgi:hypothetical protein